MNLNLIIKNLKISEIVGITDIEISDIVYDSRKATKNSVFVCLEGSGANGHDFAADAVSNGAIAIVSQNNISIPGVTIIKTENTRELLAGMSDNFFDHPSKKLKMIGITGTKGKTTVSFMIKSILESAGHKCGLIGTVGAIIGKKTTKLSNTTPESYETQKNLDLMIKSGCDYAVMEASSIGLKSHRLDGIHFRCGVFTNFSNDHIGENEHKSIDEYLECKGKLFKKCSVGFINSDDSAKYNLLKNHTCAVKTFGIKEKSDYNAKNAKLINQNGFTGITFDIEGSADIKDINIPIPGQFNVYNALAAASVCNFLGIEPQYIKDGLSKTLVKGRMERVKISSDYALFIDYAHNALSMKNILETLRKYNPARLITLFGAGGNRPKVRRFEMGEVSGNLSDFSVITSDNPRFEDPLKIIDDIKTGINKTDGKYIIIPDRKEAIRYCIKNALKGDIIVFAGKGHEDYQEIKGVKYHMDEREIIAEVLNENQNNC